jgi:hypothetical protein
MKRALLLIAAAAARLAPAGAMAAGKPVNLLLAGGPEPNSIHIEVSPDGTTYEIASSGPLEVGGSICWHPQEDAYQLYCAASAIGGFEVNAGAGDDTISVSSGVRAGATLRGGGGNDLLVGGSGADRLVGGPGDDRLFGRTGPDSLFGGPGEDILYGGPNNDTLNGGPGVDLVHGGPGTNQVHEQDGATAPSSAPVRSRTD